MFKVGINIEGSLEELLPVLQCISDHQKKELPHDIESIDQTSSGEETITWTMEKVDSIFWGVSHSCRKLLIEVAKHTEGIYTSALCRKLGVNEHGIGGILSSLGRQLSTPEFRGLQHPLVWTRDGKYKMIPIWISMILQIFEELENTVKENQ